MEPHVNPDEVRKKADAFLQDLLDRATAQSSQETARSITNLAFEAGNPVRDLFLTAVPNPPTASTSAPLTLKARTSSKFLRLTRRENKQPESKAPTQSQQAVASSSSNARSDDKQITTRSDAPAAEGSSVDPGTVSYQCIICSEDMSSKGVCKRHIDEQHVSPKIFKCERCGVTFTTKAEAKKHCNRCGLGVFTWAIVKAPTKRIYASEFTEEWFSSKSTYLEHLLKLSRKDAARLRPSLHCKLRALLNHQSLRHHVDEISQKLFGSMTAWRSMRWADDQLQKAIEQLEDAAVVHENGTIDFGGPLSATQNPLNVPLFLQELMCASNLSVSNQTQTESQDPKSIWSNAQDRHSSIATTISGRTTPPIADTLCSPQVPMDQSYMSQPSVSSHAGSGDGVDEIIAAIPQELKVKRHLSDDSRFYEPAREPPGPPMEPIHFHNPFNTQQDAQEIQMHNMAPMNLPYRSHEGSVDVHQNVHSDMSQIPLHPPLVLTEGLPSATASATTLVSNYQEPKFYESAPIGYDLWNPGQNINYVSNFGHTGGANLTYLNYSDDTSMRTPSIATEHTYVDPSEEEQKFENFVPLATYPAATYSAFMLNNDSQDQFQGANQPPG